MLSFSCVPALVIGYVLTVLLVLVLVLELAWFAPITSGKRRG
jgi:hypothetical protein